MILAEGDDDVVMMCVCVILFSGYFQKYWIQTWKWNVLERYKSNIFFGK